MKKRLLAPMLLLCAVSTNALAWSHSISIGFQPPATQLDYHYKTSGVFVDSILYRFRDIDPQLIWGIHGSLSYWHANTSQNRNLFIGAVSLGFRAYFYPQFNRTVAPYLLVTSGPAIMSNNKLGQETQGSHLTLQTTFGAGLQWNLKQSRHAIDFNLRLIHYCNGNLAVPNEGFNFLTVLSIGYLF